MKFETETAVMLHDVLRWRRDVRHFRTDPISEAILAELSSLMEHSPSVGNSRPWRVIRVKDTGLRATVRSEFQRCNAEAASTYEDARREEYTKLKLAGLDTAPEHLAVFTVNDPAEGHSLGRHTMRETLAQSTAMAIHTLWLAARVRNLGLGMVSVLNLQRIEEILTIPREWSFAAYLCLGWPEFDDDRPLLHRNGWQETKVTEWQVR